MNSAQQAPSSMWLWGYMIVFFAIAYFFIIRPKQQKENTQKSLIGGLKIGDEIMTYSGILGKIEKIVDDYILLALNEETKIKMQKHYVSNILPKGTLKSI